MVFAKADGDEFTAFLVERGFGVKSGKEEHKMGLHGSSTTALIFQDVRVPADNAEIVGVRMYGRGAADAKASLVAMLAAIGALVEVLPLHGTLVFTAVSDEEVGGINGTEYLVDRGLVHPDHVVVGEITHNRLAVAEKGIVWMRIITHGRAAHSSTPWEGANAIGSMLRVLQAVEDRIGARLRLLSHPLVPPPSINIGTIRGGVATNIVPDWCEATIDRRTLPNENVQEAVAEIDRVVADLRAQDPQLQADVAAQDVARALELQPEPVGYQQASDGRFFAERGVPTILFGPGDPEVAHAADESVDLDQLMTAAKFYAMLGQKTLSQI